MQINIFNSKEISKIYFVYVDGKGIKKKELVKMRYMDDKHCYFYAKNTGVFNKPRWRTKATITVYTQDGIYITEQIIRDTSYRSDEIMFEVDIPKAWKFQQMRAGTRKKISLPINIEFSDGVSLDSTTYDISVGGFAIESSQLLNNVQKGFPAKCKIVFPKEAELSFPDGILETSIKFVRQKAIEDEYDKNGWHMYSFKFVNLAPNNLLVLKSYLMKAE